MAHALAAAFSPCRLSAQQSEFLRAIAGIENYRHGQQGLFEPQQQTVRSPSRQ
jgi:hypothetical protein